MKIIKINTNLLNCLYRNIYVSSIMANSKFEYVRDFETDEKCLPNCWIVIRVDGKAFHKFSTKHKFNKPNDERALNLMNRAAAATMNEYKDILMAYGQSDEFSFVVRKDTSLYNRRTTKIVTYINSLFSSCYVYYWNEYFDNTTLKYPPSFDARAVLYPTNENLRDYLSWRQADCHINNLYNTTFWNLVLKGGLSNSEAEERLRGTLSSDKNEILFSLFNINYNNEPVMFKKGTILLRKKIIFKNKKSQTIIIPLHVDLIKDEFWKQNSEILDIQSPNKTELPENFQMPDLILKQLKLNCDNKCTEHYC